MTGGSVSSPARVWYVRGAVSSSTDSPAPETNEAPARPSSDRRALVAVALSLAGAALLGVPAWRYRIDHFGDDCSQWPSFATNATYAAIYLVSLALLVAGWLRIVKVDWPLRRVLAVGL